MLKTEEGAKACAGTEPCPEASAPDPALSLKGASDDPDQKREKPFVARASPWVPSPGALSPYFLGLLWAFATQVTRPHLHPQLGEAAAEEGVLAGTAEETVGK